MTKIANGLDSELFKIALDAIPNDPLPLGTLFKGLITISVFGLVGLNLREVYYPHAYFRELLSGRMTPAVSLLASQEI